MGTVIKRRRRDGSIAHHAQISIMRDRKVALRETRTFDGPQAAHAWIKKREKERGTAMSMHRERVFPTALLHYFERCP
jgi:hypothetical protein